jgi:FkbM family methyltransferase
MTELNQSKTVSSIALSNLELRSKLMKLMGKSSSFEKQPDEQLSDADVVVTCCEVSDKHGTGILVQRIFQDDSRILSVRGVNYYGGIQSFGRVQSCLSVGGLSRPDTFSAILNTLANCNPRRVICIPFKNEDVRIAIAIQALFGIPLCTYIMDDPNIYANHVSDDLMRELLEKSKLRLAISPEMKQSYQSKYRSQFWILPPVVASESIQIRTNLPSGTKLNSRKGILVGNIWGQDWLDSLRETIRGTEVKVDWYCNNANQCSWLSFDKGDMEKDGIYIHDALPESELSQIISRYSFAVLPSGTLGSTDSNKSIAALSLPSRVSFLLASSQIPIIVLGNQETAAGRFVRRFHVGFVVDYSANSFKKAVDQICIQSTQEKMRSNAAKIATIFDCNGVADWIWQSLEKGQPVDDKYEKFLPPMSGDLSYFIDLPAPVDVYRDMVPVFQGLERLKKYYVFNPDFVVDVGASTGIWSHNMAKLFPDARFILIDPLFSKYDQSSRDYHIGSHSNFETVEVAISDCNSELELKVSPDFYRSSLLSVGEDCPSELVKVKVQRLDDIAKKKQIKGRGALKIDVQFAEHLVLAGASDLLLQVDVVILELTLTRDHPQAKTFLEMMKLMDQLGFRYFDDVGDWRDPQNGVLRQKDGLFIRKIFGSDGGQPQ